MSVFGGPWRGGGTAADSAGGGRAELRGAAAGDEERLRRMLARCSRETLRLRFHLAFRSVPATVVARLAGEGLAEGGGEAVVAASGDEVWGHGMYAISCDGREAEVAVVVEDDRRASGLGARLARELARRARGRGVEVFACATLPENGRVRGLVRSVGGKAEGHYEDGMLVTRVRIAEVLHPGWPARRLDLSNREERF